MTIRSLLAPIALAFFSLSLAKHRKSNKANPPNHPPPVPPPSPAPADQRIAQLEAQVQALKTALEEIRKGPTTARSPTTAPTTPPFVLDSKYQQSLTWRSVGPAGMGGRIVDFAVVESDPSTFFVATASGGLLKTVNNGYSFTHLFDHESTVSIGCVAVAPSDPNILWLGTGENNPQLRLLGRRRLQIH